jgi:hypothetical protein
VNLLEVVEGDLLGRLANDDAFYKEISGAVVRADSLLNRIQRRGLDVNVDLW